MPRVLMILGVMAILIGGCQSTSTAPNNQYNLQVFANDLRRSMERAAKSGTASDTRLSYGCYTDRPFGKLPPAEFAEVMDAVYSVQTAIDPSSSLSATERHDTLLNYSKKGVPMAMVMLGVAALESSDVRDHEAIGAEFVRRSAMQGCPMAQALAAYLYWHGVGVGRNKANAYGWADSASFVGLDVATRLRAEIAPHLTPKELVAAKKLSAPWRQ